MAINAYECIINKYPGLKEDLDRNLDVCTFLMAVFQQLPLIMRNGHIDPRDLKVSLTMDEYDRLKVSFSIDRKKRKTFLGLDSQVLYKKNAVIVRVLETNSEIIKMVPRVIDLLTEWAHRRGLLYQDVRVSETVLPRGHLSIVSLVRERQFADDIFDSETILAIQEEARKETDLGRAAREIDDRVKSLEDDKGHGVGVVLAETK